MARHFRCVWQFLAVALLAIDVWAATTTTLVNISSRGATQPFLYVRPDNPIATIIAIPGGDGTFGFASDGSSDTRTFACNPIARNRQAFADRGFAIALVDITSGGSVYNFDDLQAVIAEARRRANVPVWVMGGSFSTAITVAIAANTPTDVPLGAIVFAPGPFSAAAVGQIRRPTQVVYHEQDTGQTGPLFFSALTTPIKERAALTGGSDTGCAFHLFNGIDALFISTTTSFMERYNSALQPTAAELNFQALWWRSPAGSENGWGVNVIHQGDTLFATWFTYDVDGSNLWLSSDLHRNGTSNTFTGQLYLSRGSPFNSLPYDSSRFMPSVVGSANLSFTDANNGTFSYTVNGVSQSKAITRYVFSGPVPTCRKGAASGTQSYDDIWWRAPAGSENGWGVNISHQGDTLFATWFTYAADGSDMWMVMSAGRKVADRTYTGDIHRTTSAPFSAYDATRFTPVLVGSGTFTFTDNNNGTFAYTVDGVAQSKPITRYVFASPVTTCSF
jgi:hypothetical protein